MTRFERAIRYLQAIQRGEPVSVLWMVERFGISKPTAKRDMVELERVLPLTSERRITHHNGYERAVLVPMSGGSL